MRVCVMSAIFLSAVLGGMTLAQPADDDKPPAPPRQAEKTEGLFLILRVADPLAAPGKADEALPDLGRYLGARVFGEGKRYEGRLAEGPEAARKVIETDKPRWAIVSPAHYLALKDVVSMTPLFEARPRGLQHERYALVAKSGVKTLDELKGARIATTLMAAPDYLDKVVLEQKILPAWVETDDVSNSLLAIADGKAEAPDAVLVDLDTADGLEQDETMRAVFSVVWKSEPLPADMAVIFPAACGEQERPRLEAALHLMKDDEEGRRLLAMLSTQSWGEVNNARLDACARLLALESKRPKPGDDKRKPADKPGESKPK